MAHEAQAGEVLTRTRSRSTDNNKERLEPELLKAVEADDVESLRQILVKAREKKQLNENFLRVGLMRSSEKGKVGATQYLLSQGANPNGAIGNRLSPLLRAIEANHAAIAFLLLAHGADRETQDKKGRTPLHTAAWEGHWHILDTLIAKGADVNGKDKKQRNVLHNLAADKRKCRWGDEIVQLLLQQNIYIDGKEGQDNLQRSPLHWACVSGKLRLAEQLLTRPKGPRAIVDAVECRGKTSLHLAAAHDKRNDRDELVELLDIVKLLLRHGADVNAKSDGGWQPLHNACERGALLIVRTLIEEGAEINTKLLNGMSPLHLAAQGGHLKVVEYLLKCRVIKRDHRDNFGFTPFLRAAQNKHTEVFTLLAPYNQVEKLSEDALGACNGFNATIVDFGAFHNLNRVRKLTVYELLYGRDSVNPRKQAHKVLPTEKASMFRWIHLPANNTAWVEALLTKAFIEEGAHDVEGFKALERSFTHQHRGKQSHSRFMRPTCQSSPRAPPTEKKPEVEENATPLIAINGLSEAQHNSSPSPRPTSRRSMSREGTGELSKSPALPLTGKENTKLGTKDKGKKPVVKGSKSPKGLGIDIPTKHHHRKGTSPLIHKHGMSPGDPGRKDATQIIKAPITANTRNIFMFMPYLHFETNRRRQEMQDAIKRAEQLPRPGIKKAATYDEMLIRAHLASSTASLHVRRTLDQSFYHNIDTGSRDLDQVVYRYQVRGNDDPDCDPKVVMVDTLWTWILGKDLIVTAFPQRWEQPKDDPLNVLDSIIEDINSKTRDPVSSVYDLSMIITNRCSGVFNRYRMGDDEFQLLDMFESSIGNATDHETILFKQFNTASVQASESLQKHWKRPNTISRYLESGSVTSDEEDLNNREERHKFEEFMRGPQFVDKLLDIGQETDLLAETKDIRDELNMIAKVLDDQLLVLPDLQVEICDIYHNEQVSQRDVKKRFEEQLKAINTHIKDIRRMDKQAERIYKSITDMLDLKQKHANAIEARFARYQATGTARQSQTIMVFTIVTIIFLPLSFIAAFFAINISEFPRSDGQESLPLAYVSKYMFGVGFAISIPLILIALLYDDIRRFLRALKGKILTKRREGKEIGRENDSLVTMQTVHMEQVFSVAKSGRRSHEVPWSARPVSRETLRRPLERAPTGFRLVGEDVEVGLVNRRS